MPAASLHRPALAHSDDHGHGHGFAAGKPGDAKAASRVIDIVMSDGPGTMSYTPDRIEVRKGEQVRLLLRNTGELPHELVLDSVESNAKHRIEMEKNPNMEHHDPNARRVLPKQSAEIVWRFTKAGTFEYACLIPGHYEAGMKGVVVVK